MRFWKLAIIVSLLGVVGMFAYDGVQLLDAHRNISNTASAAASAAAQAISTSKDCADAKPSTTKDCAVAWRKVADETAQSQGDVVTAFVYDPVAARVSVTVTGTARSLVLHYLDKNLTDDIHASSTARPA
jgi:hypothetical protein